MGAALKHWGINHTALEVIQVSSIPLWLTLWLTLPRSTNRKITSSQFCSACGYNPLQYSLSILNWNR